ncbi:hypothetical protein AHAS_Ahas19G0178300 [Arachis hypogaea]
MVGSAKERNIGMDRMKEISNLNGDDYQELDVEWNDWHTTTHSTSFAGESPDLSIKGLTDILKDGNNYYERSLDIATKQALTAEKQAEIAEKQHMLVERQVMIAEEEIQIVKIQAQAVERGITFLEQSRTQFYSKNDVYNELKKFCKNRNFYV